MSNNFSCSAVNERQIFIERSCSMIKYIFAYQDEADFVFNTSLIYEFCVLKTYVLPLLYSVKSDDPNYSEAVRLMKVLNVFLPIPSEAIPEDSILREFIGGSCF